MRARLFIFKCKKKDTSCTIFIFLTNLEQLVLKMTNVLRAALAVTIAGTAAARPRADTCGTPNTAAASCQCNGATYDFSQIKPYYNYP